MCFHVASSLMLKSLKLLFSPYSYTHAPYSMFSLSNLLVNQLFEQLLCNDLFVDNHIFGLVGKPIYPCSRKDRFFFIVQRKSLLNTDILSILFIVTWPLYSRGLGVIFLITDFYFSWNVFLHVIGILYVNQLIGNDGRNFGF